MKKILLLLFLIIPFLCISQTNESVETSVPVWYGDRQLEPYDESETVQIIHRNDTTFFWSSNDGIYINNLLNKTGQENISGSNNLILNASNQSFYITNTTESINLINNTGFNEGDIICLIVLENQVLAHDYTPSGNYKPLQLALQADFTADKKTALIFEAHDNNSDNVIDEWLEVGTTSQFIGEKQYKFFYLENNITNFLTEQTTVNLTFSSGVVEVDFKDGNGWQLLTSNVNKVSVYTANNSSRIEFRTQTPENITKIDCINSYLTNVDFNNIIFGQLDIDFNNNANLVDVQNVNNSQVFDGILFDGCTNFNPPAINTWNVSEVTTLLSCFRDCIFFNQNLNNWNVTKVTNLGACFQGCTNFNGNVSTWDVSNATNFSYLFYNCTIFNQPINDWVTASLNNLDRTFSGCTVFNQDLNNWDVSGVSLFYYCFQDCTNFNGNITTWDVSAGTRMDAMFQNCTNFNQNLSSWNVSSVTNMNGTFSGCSVFNQNLSSWNVISLTNATNFMLNSGLNTTNLDAIYNAWSLLTLQPGVSINFSPTQYTIATSGAAKTILTSAPNNWIIIDGGGI